MLDKKTGNLVTTKNTANDYVLSFNNGPVLVKGNAAVVSSKAYKEENEPGGGVYLQWQYEICKMEDQCQRMDNDGI